MRGVADPAGPYLLPVMHRWLTLILMTAGTETS
jgi:hypothetical protein